MFSFYTIIELLTDISPKTEERLQHVGSNTQLVFQIVLPYPRM